MGEHNGRSSGVEPGKIFIQPGEGFCRDGGLVCLGPFTGIEPDDLPAAMLEGVIDLVWKDLLVRGTIGIGEMIVIADDGVTWNAKGGKRLFDEGQLRWRAIVGEIAA